ncbi:MAG: hypothetical protein N2C14_22295, partial [Planctomycetales bacterium]
MNPRPRPMLCQAAEPFNSPSHSFEIKWDGVRVLAGVESGRLRMWGRSEATDWAERYPELDALRRLPSGTVVDGETVLLRDGLPSLSALLSRHALSNPRKILHAARRRTATYMLFDVLYHRGESVMDRPLIERRRLLEELVERLGDGESQDDEARFRFSEGTRNHGKARFKSVVEQGHEGLVAKHLAGRYHPGRRHAAWRKIKPVRELAAVVIGYRGGDRLRSLLAAAPDEQGRLTYVAELSHGFSRSISEKLLPLLAAHRRRQPLVPCEKQAAWVDPVIRCRV